MRAPTGRRAGWFGHWPPRGSLMRHLLLRLIPPVVILVVIDLGITWFVVTQIDLDVWLWRDIFWAMLISQLLLVSLFAWVLVSGVRSGLDSVNRIVEEINQRSVDELYPLDVSGLATEMVPVVEHINGLLGRLDEAVQAQRRFIGHAAHQLRTPLSGLRLESELMLARELPDDVRLRAERIKQVSDRMIRLGQQLLVLARAEPTARAQDSFIRLDLADWVRMAGAEWVPRARAAQVDLQLDAPDKAVWVDADPILLEALLDNLIDNALRYADGASTIRLVVQAAPPSLMVEDDGRGIAPPEQKRVFEAFYRASASHPEPGVPAQEAVVGARRQAPGKQEGSGLGLAIVREIAQAHGAWWSLVSQPQWAGTRISIVFPGPRMGTNLNRQEQQS